MRRQPRSFWAGRRRRAIVTRFGRRGAIGRGIRLHVLRLRSSRPHRTHDRGRPRLALFVLRRLELSAPRAHITVLPRMLASAPRADITVPPRMLGFLVNAGERPNVGPVRAHLSRARRLPVGLSRSVSRSGVVPLLALRSGTSVLRLDAASGQGRSVPHGDAARTRRPGVVTTVLRSGGFGLCAGRTLSTGGPDRTSLSTRPSLSRRANASPAGKTPFDVDHPDRLIAGPASVDAIDVEHLTDRVVAVLDRRLWSHRERMGGR